MSVPDSTGYLGNQNIRAHGNSKTQEDFSKYNLREAVKLPDEEKPNEWIAYNLFEFHKLCFMLYETISDYCNEESCPAMTAGPKYKYLWSDDQRLPVEQCARDYIYRVLDWVQEQLDNNIIFPSNPSDDFPPNFKEICQTIARRLSRVYAHIHHHHLPIVRELKEEAHMNTSLKHFIYFIIEFDLVPPNELDPLKDFVQSIT